MKSFTFTFWRIFMNHPDSLLKSAGSEINSLDIVFLLPPYKTLTTLVSRVVFIFLFLFFCFLQNCWESILLLYY